MRAAAARLLTSLVDYHRREAKPGWWAFFERLKKSLDELRLDTEAIAYLSPASGVEPHADGRNLVHVLEFPDQEFKVRSGKVMDTVEGREAGTIVDIFPNGQLTLRRGRALFEVPLPNAVMSDGPVRTDAQRASLVRIGDAFVAGGDRHCVGRDLLTRAMPRIAGRNLGSILQTMNMDEQKALVGALDESYLFIQGPPGSGRRTFGARLIVSLLEAGKRVAVTATSHKAIHNLIRQRHRRRARGTCGGPRAQEDRERRRLGLRGRRIREHERQSRMRRKRRQSRRRDVMAVRTRGNGEPIRLRSSSTRPARSPWPTRSR